MPVSEEPRQTRKRAYPKRAVEDRISGDVDVFSLVLIEKRETALV